VTPIAFLGPGFRPPRLRFVVDSPFWGHMRGRHGSTLSSACNRLFGARLSAAKTQVCRRLAFLGPSERLPRFNFVVCLSSRCHRPRAHRFKINELATNFKSIDEKSNFSKNQIHSSANNRLRPYFDGKWVVNWRVGKRTLCTERARFSGELGTLVPIKQNRIVPPFILTN
jgi:hypothetical protein